LAATKLDKKKGRGVVSGAQQVATEAFRKLLNVDGSNRLSLLMSDGPSLGPHEMPDPLSGWQSGVSVLKSHFVLLLKPQIVLKSETDMHSVCVLAAVQAKSQAFAILDDMNSDDPISGRVMTR
jgi:hypothetical protein